MDKTKMLENLCQKLIDGNMDGITISDLSRQALDSGIEPLEILENGISKGMEIVGKRFETGEAFLPELIFAADAFKSAMEVISPALEASNQNVEKTNQSQGDTERKIVIPEIQQIIDSANVKGSSY